MKAIIKHKPHHPPQWYRGLELVEKKEPEVTFERPIKVRVLSSGICGTDVGIYLGKESLAHAMASIDYPEITIGHEFAGEIVEIHPSARSFIAQRLYRRKYFSKEVTDYLSYHNETVNDIERRSDFVSFINTHFYVSAEMHLTCGQCLQCRTGHEHVCKNTIGKGLHEDGAFAQYMLLPANRIVFFEKNEIPLEIVSFMDALGNTVHTAQCIDLAGKSVLITGAGVQGLMSCAVARQLGAHTIYITDVVAQNQEGATVDKLAIARKLGADYTFDVSSEKGKQELSHTVKRHTDDTGVDVVFEMSGHYGAYKQAFENIRMGGTMLLLGLPSGKLEVDFSREVIFKGLTIRGIYGRRIFDTWDMMRFLLNKRLTQIIMEGGIITHQLPLEDFENGFSALIRGEAIKVLLKP